MFHSLLAKIRERERVEDGVYILNASWKSNGVLIKLCPMSTNLLHKTVKSKQPQPRTYADKQTTESEFQELIF